MADLPPTLRKLIWRAGRVRLMSVLSLVFLTVTCCLVAQQSDWLTYNGAHFSFKYPNGLQLREIAPSDVSVSNDQYDFEIAVGRAKPKDLEQMVLKAEKHVSDFAAANHMRATFEGWKEMGSDAVLVISHLRSDRVAIDVVSSMKRGDTGVLLLQIMHPPGTTKEATDLGSRIAETISLKE